MTSVSSLAKMSLGCALVLITLAAARPARAQTGSTLAQQEASDAHLRTAARTLAAQGAAAFEKQDYVAALDLFQRAGTLVDAPTIVVMEARTLVQLRRWVEAADKYAKARNMSGPDANNAAFQMAVQAADEELEALKPRIPMLKIELRGQASEEAEVRIDGQAIPGALVGVDTPVDPGNHTVEVRRTDHPPTVREIMLREGERQDLRVELEPKQTAYAAAPKPVAPRVAPPAPRASQGDSPTLGWVLLGSGTAATLVGAGTGLYALNRKSELDRVCNPGCPADREGDIDAFRRYRTVSYLGFGLGVAGLAFGSYVLLVGTPSRPEVGLHLSPRQAILSGAF